MEMVTETEAPESSEAVPAKSIDVAGIAGVVGAGFSLGISELVAGLFAGVPSLVDGVATLVIDTVPKPVKDLAISLFGTSDKLALGIGIVVVTLAIGVWAGRRSLANPTASVVVFSAAGLLGAMAAARAGDSPFIVALVSGAAAAAAGLTALRLLLRLGTVADVSDSDNGRRRFLIGAGATAAFTVLAGLLGRNLSSATTVDVAARADVALPTPVETVPSPSAAATLDVPGISPLVTPTSDFYRIDTAFVPPRIDATTWSMRVTGMVDREIELNYADLLEMDMVERYITIACVSNSVGGELVGNAKWLGVPLRNVLDLAGVGAGAEQLVGRSTDRFTVGFPVEAAFDGRDALVAVAMNDEPLPIEHGFPARLVVAGLYGYVSATKWLDEIFLTKWDAFDAYWIPRGWSKEAPIKTQTRIDVPTSGSIQPGARAVAGVAWAPNRGISRVEVRIDDGDWQEAELAASLDDDSWRQWSLPWTPTAGSHTIEARATDGTGEVQTEVERPPAPDGASGYHTITVRV